MKRPGGLALTELLIAAALFSLLLTVALASLTTYSRAYRGLTERQPDSRSLARALRELSRLAREAHSLSGPDLAEGLAPTRDRPLVLDGQRIFFDPARQEVRLAGDAGEQTLGQAAGLAVRLEQLGRHRFLLVRLEDKPGRLPWQTRVALANGVSSPGPAPALGSEAWP